MKQVLAAVLVAASSMAFPHAQTQAPEATDVSGVWAITTESPVGENTNNMEIKKDGEKLVAVAKGENGDDYPYDKAELKGSDITLVITIDYQGSPMTITYTGSVDGRKMAGDADFGGLATGTWSAVKK